MTDALNGEKPQFTDPDAGSADGFQNQPQPGLTLRRRQQAQIFGLGQLLLLRAIDGILKLQASDLAVLPALKIQEAVEAGQHGVNGAHSVALLQQGLFVGHHHFLRYLLSTHKTRKSTKIPEIFFNGCSALFFQNQIFVKCADTIFRQLSFAHLCFLLHDMN